MLVQDVFGMVLQVSWRLVGAPPAMGLYAFSMAISTGSVMVMREDESISSPIFATVFLLG